MATCRPVKRTKEELARSIIQDGEFDHFHSSKQFRYYRAFGQNWILTYSSGGTLRSIEQIDENGKRIGF